MSWSETTQFQIRRDVIGSHLPDEEAVLLDLDAGNYYGLNAQGAFVWRLLEKPILFRDLVLAMLEEFEVDSATCETDLKQLLQQLAEKQLIHTFET